MVEEVTIKKTGRMLREERRLGKPLEVILVEKYHELGSVRKVGDALDIDYHTVHFWMKNLGVWGK